MYKSLDHAISRFESEDLTSIVVGLQTRGKRHKQSTIEPLRLRASGVGVAARDQQADPPTAVQAHDPGQL